jgi:biopolymer transport protein ExbD
MAKIRKEVKRETPALATTSLPDIVFIFLFFFMMVTSMREVTLRVRITLPQATELTKLENKSLVRHIFIGRPTAAEQRLFGTETRLQIGDAFVDVSQVQDIIITERSAMREVDQAQMVVSIRADQDTRMGIITDVKQSLRRAYALRVNYAANLRTNH